MDGNSESNQQRRTFLGILLGGVGVVLAGFLSWPIFRFLAPRAGAGEGAKVTVAKAEVKVGGAKFFAFQGHPAVLLQPKPGEFVALTAVCTHLGCIIKWVDAKGEFLCPCHGGRFSSEGKVLGGPPPKPLKSYTVTIGNTDLVVG
ncbi:ubiquinol-cytochrome c reductase iron-sulfur subunit [Geopsychrobacter electrodiphilus]|uniref:QcrA and Rieske domain-containing protein n=1 Tax=Geopsychrobacter electrodiphilus TaxID=225196 RepID=UPI000376FCA1|nr:ubiquinol-cytochrome c reductase iron-sulfur subunit [Geopsychrobacter electrodiphilus]